MKNFSIEKNRAIGKTNRFFIILVKTDATLPNVPTSTTTFLLLIQVMCGLKLQTKQYFYIAVKIFQKSSKNQFYSVAKFNEIALLCNLKPGFGEHVTSIKKKPL